MNLVFATLGGSSNYIRKVVSKKYIHKYNSALSLVRAVNVDFRGLKVVVNEATPVLGYVRVGGEFVEQHDSHIFSVVPYVVFNKRRGCIASSTLVRLRSELQSLCILLLKTLMTTELPLSWRLPSILGDSYSNGRESLPDILLCLKTVML